MSKVLGTIWVCQCCMLTHANGECCADDQHGGDGREPLSLIGAGESVTLGMSAEEHADGCTEDVRNNHGCDCERREFSWSSCDGCGSVLGGDRFALTLWDDSVPELTYTPGPGSIAGRLTGTPVWTSGEGWRDGVTE